MLCVEIIEENSELILNEESEPYLIENSEGQEIKDKKINNRHDKCFQDILSDKNEIISLLKDFVNPENTIKAKEIEPYNTSFITSKYQNREADVVYKIKGYEEGRLNIKYNLKRNDKKKMEEIAKNAMKEGMKKSLINMAKKLKELNIPIEQIIQVTGLSEEKIKSIR